MPPSLRSFCGLWWHEVQVAAVAVTALWTSAEWQTVHTAPNSLTCFAWGTRCLANVTVSGSYTPACSWHITPQYPPRTRVSSILVGAFPASRAAFNMRFVHE